MRLCIVKNFVRRSVFYKFNKYLALTGVFSACGKFAVRKSSGTAFAELYIACCVKNTAFPKVMYIFRSGIYISATLD